MDGDGRLIAALVDQGQAWYLVGPCGQANQRDDDGREVVLLMATREDAESIARDRCAGDEPRACVGAVLALVLEGPADVPTMYDGYRHLAAVSALSLHLGDEVRRPRGDRRLNAALPPAAASSQRGRHGGSGVHRPRQASIP